jgi:polysaccharide biosynthesis protein PslF
VKVLLITAAFPPMQMAGEADHAFHLCTHLVEAGVNLQVITTRGNVAITRPGLHTLPVIQHWSWKALPLLAKYIKQWSPHAILLMYSSGPHYHYHPMVTFLPTVAKLIRPKIPFVTQFENVYPPHWTSWPDRLARKGLSPWIDPFGTLLRHSDHIIVLSEHQRDILAKHAPTVPNQCVLIPPPPLMPISPENNGATRQRGRKLLAIEPREFLLIYFGYIYQGKGLETLLKAFQIVVGQKQKIRLALVGGQVALPARPSYGQEMQALSKQLGLYDRVIWTGEYNWNSDEASVYLHAADACILPFDKGIQLNNSSFAAAAAHGLPIITTRGTLVEQPFIHRENVFLCPSQNPQALAAAILALMNTPALCQHLHLGSLKLAQDWFSWTKATERTIKTLSVKATVS